MSEPPGDERSVLEIERPEQLKALGHPLRLKVLQALGESDAPLTNRELAGRLEVDPGHLHFHVRMLARAGLIEPAPGQGREKPYRPVATTLRIGPAIRAAGLASEVQATQLGELRRAFDRFASAGEFSTIQVHVKADPERLRELLTGMAEQLADDDESQPLQAILIAFHPAIAQGESG